jgi:hypothetical protein
MDSYLGRLGFDAKARRGIIKGLRELERRPARTDERPKLMPRHLARARKRTGEQQ